MCDENFSPYATRLAKKSSNSRIDERSVELRAAMNPDFRPEIEAEKHEFLGCEFLIDLVKKCWRENPKDRLTFEQIFSFLKEQKVNGELVKLSPTRNLSMYSNLSQSSSLEGNVDVTSKSSKTTISSGSITNEDDEHKKMFVVYLENGTTTAFLLFEHNLFKVVPSGQNTKCEIHLFSSITQVSCVNVLNREAEEEDVSDRNEIRKDGIGAGLGGGGGGVLFKIAVDGLDDEGGIIIVKFIAEIKHEKIIREIILSNLH